MWESNQVLQAAWKNRAKLYEDAVELHQLVKKFKSEGNFKWKKGQFIYQKGSDSPILLFSHKEYGNIVKDEAIALWVKSKQCEEMRDRLRAEGDRLWESAIRSVCGKINFKYTTEKNGQYCIFEDGTRFAPV